MMLLKTNEDIPQKFVDNLPESERGQLSFYKNAEKKADFFDDGCNLLLFNMQEIIKWYFRSCSSQDDLEDIKADQIFTYINAMIRDTVADICGFAAKHNHSKSCYSNYCGKSSLSYYDRVQVDFTQRFRDNGIRPFRIILLFPDELYPDPIKKAPWYYAISNKTPPEFGYNNDWNKPLSVHRLASNLLYAKVREMYYSSRLFPCMTQNTNAYSVDVGTTITRFVGSLYPLLMNKNNRHVYIVGSRFDSFELNCALMLPNVHYYCIFKRKDHSRMLFYETKMTAESMKLAIGLYADCYKGMKDADIITDKAHLQSQSWLRTRSFMDFRCRAWKDIDFYEHIYDHWKGTLNTFGPNETNRDTKLAQSNVELKIRSLTNKGILK